MSIYKVEKGGPLPPVIHPTNRKYPFGDMEVGEVFYAPIDERKRIRSAANMYGKRTGTKFSTRTLGNSDRLCVMRIE